MTEVILFGDTISRLKLVNALIKRGATKVQLNITGCSDMYRYTIKQDISAVVTNCNGYCLDSTHRCLHKCLHKCLHPDVSSVYIFLSSSDPVDKYDQIVVDNCPYAEKYKIINADLNGMNS